MEFRRQFTQVDVTWHEFKDYYLKKKIKSSENVPLDANGERSANENHSRGNGEIMEIETH